MADVRELANDGLWWAQEAARDADPGQEAAFWRSLSVAAAERAQQVELAQLVFTEEEFCAAVAHFEGLGYELATPFVWSDAGGVEQTVTFKQSQQRILGLMWATVDLEVCLSRNRQAVWAKMVLELDDSRVTVEGSYSRTLKQWFF